jgi:hypothetical protein
MYDMALQDVAIMPKMSKVHHWMDGRVALTSMEKMHYNLHIESSCCVCLKARR